MPSATAAGQTAVHCGRGFHGQGGCNTPGEPALHQGGTAAAAAALLAGPGHPAPGLLP